MPMGMKMERCWGSLGGIELLLVSLNGGIAAAFCVVERGFEGRCVGNQHEDGDELWCSFLLMLRT